MKECDDCVRSGAKKKKDCRICYDRGLEVIQAIYCIHVVLAYNAQALMEQSQGDHAVCTHESTWSFIR